MANNTIVCPVCGKEMSSFSSFCPNCSFEIHILPDAAPKQILELEEIRIENSKRAWNIQAQKLSLKDNEIEELRGGVAPLEEKVNNLQAQNSQLQDNLNKKQEELAAMNQQVKKLNNELQEMKSNPASINSQEATEGKLPFAYLVVFNGQDAQLVLNLFKGENSFGTAPATDGHQQLLLGDDEIQDCHFAVKASASLNSKGRRRASYAISPVQGEVYRAANKGNKISGEEPLEINDSFYAGSIKFTILDNKNNKNKD